MVFRHCIGKGVPNVLVMAIDERAMPNETKQRVCIFPYNHHHLATYIAV